MTYYLGTAFMSGEIKSRFDPFSGKAFFLWFRVRIFAVGQKKNDKYIIITIINIYIYLYVFF